MCEICQCSLAGSERATNLVKTDLDDGAAVGHEIACFRLELLGRGRAD